MLTLPNYVIYKGGAFFKKGRHAAQQSVSVQGEVWFTLSLLETFKAALMKTMLDLWSTGERKNEHSRVSILIFPAGLPHNDLFAITNQPILEVES